MKISFDLWNTIFKNNPEYKKYLFSKVYPKYNIANKTSNEISTRFKLIEELIDFSNETSGNNIPSTSVMAMQLMFLSDEDKYFTANNLKYYSKDLTDSFLKYPPFLYDEHTYTVLNNLKNDGHELYIISNTVLIQGQILKKVLKLHNIEHLFNECIFSDEVGISKPNSNIFLNVDYHVGDNPFADRTRNFYQINTNSRNILDFYQFLNKN